MDVVNAATGEIIKSPFRTMYSGIKKTAEDCSDPYQKTYKELPPYAVDPETKKILNKKSVPVLVEDEPFNIDEYIQSFKDDCDIYTILEKFAEICEKAGGVCFTATSITCSLTSCGIVWSQIKL